MFVNRLKRGVAGFNKATTRGGRVFILALLALIGAAIIFTAVNTASQAYDDYRSNHLSPAGDLTFAKDVCASGSGSSGICSDPDDALHHLERIPTTAPEYGEASKLIASIRQQEHHLSLEAARSEQQLKQQEQQEGQGAEEQSREQMLRNFQGTANDAFLCSTSAYNRPIVSFDSGQHWWIDDGRCARKEEQERRDATAKPSSYWPTTLRVDTDIDSSWLPNEERTCQTYPDDKGEIAVVACNATGSPRDHNIPVEFWGGVDRNIVSDWRCRREKNLLNDKFVCRAID